METTLAMLVETMLVETMLMETIVVETTLVTALVETMLKVAFFQKVRLVFQISQSPPQNYSKQLSILSLKI